MRLRKVKNALENLEQNEKYFVKNPKNNKGNWNKVFNNDNPISIEIGCGKGSFIIEMAKTFKDINFIAIEKFESVLIRASEKTVDSNLDNLLLLHYDALLLNEVFSKDEISNIYLNFSDPWPKTRHEKRRLTSKEFLKCYKGFLKEDGAIIQKTDNRGLFEFSLESLSQNDFYISNVSVDLHSDDTFNINTEYEIKKSKLGPIYKLEARIKKNDNE